MLLGNCLKYHHPNPNIRLEILLGRSVDLIVRKDKKCKKVMGGENMEKRW